MFTQFQPDNFVDYLGNPLFHSTDKGCKMETIENFNLGKEGHPEDSEKHYYNQMCHTHNELCSKTGWKLHYYQGEKSNSEKGGVCVCKRCGKSWAGRIRDYCTKCKRANELLYKEANNIPMNITLRRSLADLKWEESLNK